MAVSDQGVPGSRPFRLKRTPAGRLKLRQAFSNCISVVRFVGRISIVRLVRLVSCISIVRFISTVNRVSIARIARIVRIIRFS
jgi:hypothetical protein